MANLIPEKKAEYKTLQRKCQEAHYKLFDRGNFNRIKSKSPNLFNNRLQRMKEFCIENKLTESRWLKIQPIIDS